MAAVFSSLYLVYAVEASNIAMQAKMVVEANNISNIITVLHGRVEDVEIEERVDVIISEWMGYMLLHESMLESVIIARNRWLKPGGLMLPSHTKLYMAPITNTNRYCDSIDFWHDVHGIDMSAMIPFAKQCEFEEPCLETIESENVLASPHVVKDINCYSVTSSDIKLVTSRFTFNSMINAPLHGFAFWFDAEFIENVISPLPIRYQLPTSVADNLLVCGSPRETEVNLNKALLLSTAPEGPPTHWQQTLIYLYNPMELEKDQLIEGCVTLSQSQEHARSINIRLEYTVAGQSFVKMAVMK